MEAIKVNLIPNGIPEACHTSQYDVGRQIRLNLFDGLTPYTIQAGDTFTLNVRKPDNHVITETVTGTEGNTYLIIDTTEQMTAVTGENLCEIRLENGGDNIGSLNFIMQVEKDVIANGIPSESVIEDLEALVVEAVGDNYYTKTETDELLAQKADVNDLLDLLPTDNASGAVANFTDGADDVPVKALSVEFAASQASGTPTPSSPIPITPVNSIKVTRTGKNFFDKSKMVIASQRFVKYGVDNYNDTLPNGKFRLNANQAYTFTFSGDNSTNFESFGVYNDAGTRVAIVYNNKKATFTPASTGAYFLAFAVSAGNWGGTWDNYDIQLEVGSTATAYEAYNGVTKTLALGGDYYGGEVDALSGEITALDEGIDLSELTVTSAVKESNLWRITFASQFYTGAYKLGKCNKLTFKDTYAGVNGNNNTIGFNAAVNKQILIRNDEITTSEEMITFVATLFVVYPLATPATAQASNAIDFNTLLGDNNIFSDAGDVDVTIRADIALYIQKMLGGNANRSLGANPSILRTGAISTDIEVSEPVELEREVTEQPENEGNDNEEL